MADKKITALTEQTVMDSLVDVLALADITATATKKITIKVLKRFVRTATAVSISTTNDDLIGVTDTSALRTITVSTADIVDGYQLVVNDESGLAGTNNITIATQGSELIDGAATATISTNYGSIWLYSDGTNLFTI